MIRAGTDSGVVSRVRSLLRIPFIRKSGCMVPARHGRCKTKEFRQDSSMSRVIMAFLAPGGGELLVVMLALLLLFGPKDAPRVLRRGLDVLRKIQQLANRFKNDLLSASLDPDVQVPANDSSVQSRERPARPSPTPPPPPPPGETPS